MKRRKVISFFVALMLFTGVLMAIEISQYGSLTGFITYNESAEEQEQDFSDFSRNSYWVAFLIVAFIFVTAFFVKYLRKYHEKEHHEHHGHSRRKLIHFKFE